MCGERYAGLLTTEWKNSPEMFLFDTLVIVLLLPGSATK